MAVATRRKHQCGRPPLRLMLNLQIIEQVSEHRHPGVVLDDQLKWQICICSLASDTFVTFFHAHIMSRINYICRGFHRVTDLKRFPVRVSKDDAPTPLPALGPLFITPLLFHLSRASLGAWRFGLFRCVYSSFHKRLDLIREPAFYWVFYFSFPVYSCLFHHS